jgi:hypothetical protein
MSLNDLAAIGSFISGIAVVITLAFLVIQLRQTNRNQIAIINQGAVARDTAIVQMLPQPGFLSAWVKVVAGENDFSASDYFQITFVLRVILGGLQDCYVQRRAGLIDQITYDYVERGARYFLGQPIVRIAWSQTRDVYSTEFAAVVDRLIAEVPLTPAVNLAEVVKQELAKYSR